MKRLALFLIVAVAMPVSVAVAGQAQCSAKACDLDGDGYGSLLGDYAVFFAAFGKSRGEAGFNAKADFDGDGAVTNEDFSVLQKFCPLGGGSR